jgi:S1-C subfamily serine protease
MVTRPACRIALLRRAPAGRSGSEPGPPPPCRWRTSQRFFPLADLRTIAKCRKYQIFLDKNQASAKTEKSLKKLSAFFQVRVRSWDRPRRTMSTEGTVPMTSTYDPPRSPETGQTPPGPAGFGPDSADYGIPAGYGGGRHSAPKSPVRRFGRPVLTAGVALAVGLGTFFGLQAASGQSSSALSTYQIAAQTDPGLVDIVSTLGYQQAQAAGTGLVLTSSGEVLTNNHVIDGATSIRVTDIGNGHSYQAKVVGYDQTKDIAVLQLQGASGLPTVNLGNSSTAAVGQKVVALGNAEGKGGTPSVVTGKITGLNAAITASGEGSGTSEQLGGLISHNAPIQPGDSGGPLVNTAGQVIGIDTAGSSSSSPQETAQTTATQAFAIPINEALSVAHQIEAGHASATVHIGATGFLGVEVASASNAEAEGVPTGSGAAVAGVLSGSPAENAGLAAGDVITSVDGQVVSSPSALQAAMEQHRPGDRVTIGWTDAAGQSRSASVSLATGPAA